MYVAIRQSGKYSSMLSVLIAAEQGVKLELGWKQNLEMPCLSLNTERKAGGGAVVHNIEAGAIASGPGSHKHM